MFDPFNIVFILVIVVVFIGRAVIQAKKPPPKPPEIPVHFEDDDEPESAMTRESAHGAKTTSPVIHAAKTSQNKSRLQTSLSPSTLTSGRAAVSKPSPAGTAGAGAVSQAQGGVTLNLNHLSPMKQAVVMAEILGTPRGLADKP